MSCLPRFIHPPSRLLKVNPLHARCLATVPTFEIGQVELPVTDSGHPFKLRPSAATVSALHCWLFDWLTGDDHYCPLKTVVPIRPAWIVAEYEFAGRRKKSPR